MTTAGPSRSHILHDDSRWPLCCATFIGDPSLSDHQQTLAWYDSLLARKQPFALICDNRAMTTRPPASVNDAIKAFVQTRRELLGAHCVGAGMVVGQNILIRMALQGLLMLARLPVPHRVTDSLADAELWCRKQLLSRRDKA